MESMRSSELAHAGLLPCPFCGEPARYDWIEAGCAVKCHSCDVSVMRGGVGVGWYATEAEAAADWNRRAQPAPAQDERKAHVPDKVFRDEFMVWWEDHGQFCRAGGGDYERTFAFQAWRHLYPMLMQARATRPAQTEQPPEQSGPFAVAAMSGGGKFTIELHFETLAGMQAYHAALIAQGEIGG
ncbi:Lar family restriction alleviation protein [Pseudomonas aeruginosa]